MENIFNRIIGFFVDLVKGIIGFILILVLVFLLVFFILGGWLIKKYSTISSRYDTCIDTPVTTDIEKYIKNQKFDVDIKTRYVTVLVDNKVFLSPILDTVLKIKLPDKIANPFNKAGNILYTSLGWVLHAKKMPPHVCLKVVDNSHIDVFLSKDWYLWGSMQIATYTNPSGFKIQGLKIYTFNVPEKYVREYMADEANFLFDVGNVPISSISFSKNGVVLKYYVSNINK